MAKRSAASKGYRNYQKKTWWQKKTKEEQDKFVKLCLIAAIAAVVVILLIIFVPRIVDNTKNLKVVDGAVQVDENVIVCNIGSRDEPKYRQMAVINGAVDGYTEAEESTAVTDNNVRAYNFNGENATYTIMSSVNDAQTSAETYHDRIIALGDIETQTDVLPVTVNGRNGAWLSTVIVPMDLSDAQNEELPPYRQSGIIYADSTFKGKSLMCNIMIDLDSLDQALSDEDMLALLQEIAGTVTMAER